MKRIDRYILNELFRFFFALLVLIGVVFTIQRLIFLTEWSMYRGVGMIGVFKLLACLFPSLFLIAIPLVSLMVMVVVFSRLCEENELIVIFCSGKSLTFLLKLGFVFSFFSALLVGYLSFFLVPRSLVKFRLLRYELVRAKSEALIPAQRFVDFDEKGWIYVQKKDEKGLKHIIIFQDNSGFNILGARGRFFIFAEQARIENLPETKENRILLKNGVIVARDPKNQLEYFLQFKEAKARLGLPERERTEKEIKSHPELATLWSLFSMLKKREAGQKGSSRVSFFVQLRIELYERLSAFFSTLIIFLWGVGLGIKPPRTSRTVSYFLGILAGFCYYYLRVVFKALALKGLLLPELAMWLPFLIILFSGMWLIKKRLLGKEPLLVLYQSDVYFKNWLERRRR